MKTKEEIKKELLNKEFSFWDAFICFVEIHKIDSPKKIKKFFSDLDHFLTNCRDLKHFEQIIGSTKGEYK